MERVDRPDTRAVPDTVAVADTSAVAEPATASVDAPVSGRSVSEDPVLAGLSPSTEIAVDTPDVFADPAAGVGPASTGELGSRQDVRVGMEVVGFDGESVGLVKEIRTIDFLLDRVMRRDLYVPFSAVEKVVLDVVPERVVLNVRGADVAVMDWQSPPLT